MKSGRGSAIAPCSFTFPPTRTGNMKTLRFWQRVAVALSLVFSVAAVSWAADVNGRIKGTVTDASGAVVGGVHVTATNEATGVVFTTTSGSDGVYLFAQLPVGKYDVAAISQNFKRFAATGIILNIDQEYIENIQLVVGSTNETVQISASAVQLDTTDMQLSNIVNSEQMEELPLINRAFTDLELTLPGVQASSDRFGSFSVSGAETQQSEYLINGADTNDIALNTIAIQPNLDALDQFNLIDGPLNAEYDRNSGGIVSATIKEGTNHFHGDAFEFYRDTFLNTANFYQHDVDTGQSEVSPYHQNIYGGTVGGPILKDKLFFFGAYEGQKERTPAGGSVAIYNSSLLTGNFSADLSAGNFSSNPIPGTITIPGCAPTSSGPMTWAACAAALNGQFPTSVFNPVALKLIQAYIPPSLVNNGEFGYQFTGNNTLKENQFIGRIDFALNPKNQFYGLYIYQSLPTTEQLPFTGASVPGFGEVDTDHINQVTFDYVHEFTPSLVNDLSAHWTRFNFGAVFPEQVIAPSSYGFDINPENTTSEQLPVISVSSALFDGGGFTLGFSNNGPQPRIDQVYQLDDSISKVIGQHTLKFGYDGRRFNVSNPFSAENNGNFSFNSGGVYSSGDGALDFLLGVPAGYGQGSGATIQADAFLNYVYGQDTWKATNSLTIDYGLSYSIDTPLHNNQYQGEGIICFIPGFNSTIFSGAPTGLAYPGESGCSNSGLATTRYSELGPRLGFAWAPDLGGQMKWLTGGAKKLAIRGGVGFYYNRTEEETSLQTLETPPFGLSSSGAVDYASQGATASSFVDPYVDLNSGTTYNNKFPYAFPHKGETISSATWASVEPMFLSTYDSTFRAPYAENFQLSIEREVPSHAIVRISYIASLGRHNQTTYEGDYETAAGHAACLANPSCSGYDPTVANGESYSTGVRNFQMLVYPQNTIGDDADLAGVGEVGATASSNYNSLQAEITKAPTHGLTFQLSYTYSHALDTASSFENAGFAESSRGFNRFDPALNYGNANFDARQRLVFSPIYTVPKFAGSAYSPMNLAVAGWEISGIVTVATGFPYDISYSDGTSRSLWCANDLSFYACPDIPVQVAPLQFGNPRIRNSVTGESLLITNAQQAFTNEPIGGFGNEGRDKYHGPGINNTNMILAKNFMVVPERNVSLQLRMESDNVFNHTQFSNPASNFNCSFNSSGDCVITSGLGYISSAASGRQTQLAVKVYF
jgi:Carboxypeptidase regulatory-like domain